MIITIILDSAISHASWDAVIEAIHRTTPLMLVRRHGVLQAGTDTIDEIRQHVRQWSARAAMAPDRTSSLFCALQAVPGRIDAHASADHVDCRVLLECPELDIDKVILNRLRLFGCSTIGLLMTLSERHLRAQFGDSGVRMYRLLHTTSHTLPLYQPPDEICVSMTFDDVVCEPGMLLDAGNQLCQSAYNALAGRHAWRVDVGVLGRSGCVEARRGRIMRAAITTLQQISVHIDALIRQLLGSLRRWWGIRVRLTSLRLPQSEQVVLFQPRASARELQSNLVPKYGAVIKDIEIVNPWSIIPEEFARIRGRQP